VATLAQTALDDLKRLLLNGALMYDVMLNDLKEIADAAANELLDYFQDFEAARAFAEMLLLPHHHHHEKKVKKSLSGGNLLKLVGSANGVNAINECGVSATNMMHASASRRELASTQVSGEQAAPGVSILNESTNNLSPVTASNNHKTGMKYQYSFTDSIVLDEFASTADFKENTKFKKKGNFLTLLYAYA
jgi:hypothetical protein